MGAIGIGRGGARGTSSGGVVADEAGDRGDHGGEPRAKKNAYGLEDHGAMPVELQERVITEVAVARRR